MKEDFKQHDQSPRSRGISFNSIATATIIAAPEGQFIKLEPVEPTFWSPRTTACGCWDCPPQIGFQTGVRAGSIPSLQTPTLRNLACWNHPFCPDHDRERPRIQNSFSRLA